MRRFGWWLGRILLGLALVALGLWLFGPRERLALKVTYDLTQVPPPPALDAFLAQEEAQVTGIRPGAQKRIVWAGAPGARTEIALVYLHGFSATSEEIRPVPDKVAAALGANLFYTRLTGHGQDGAAMAAASAQDWVNDTAEAIEVGQRLGDRVFVIGTSTGGTLAALAANQPGMAEKLAGVVFISPNFGLKNPVAKLLTWPLARYWVPLVAGRERCFEAANPRHAQWWTTCYPTAALFQMAELADHVGLNDYFGTGLPALFIYSLADQVVDPERTGQVAGSWAGPMVTELREMGPGDDPSAHVIAGDILSPGQTEPVSTLIADWIARFREPVIYEAPQDN